MNDLVEPVIERIPKPLWCAYCYAIRGYVAHYATHTVDGTSVCGSHLRAAVERARENRR